MDSLLMRETLYELLYVCMLGVGFVVAVIGYKLLVGYRRGRADYDR